MGGTPQEQEDVMTQWMNWFGALGESVLEMGSPFSGSLGIASDGSRTDASANLTGYSVLEAETLEDAGGLVAKCPVLGAGGSVEIYEVLPM
jgi:hypothetical protein